MVTQIWGVWQAGNQRFDLRKKNTPERESFVIAYGQRQRHNVTARAHFLFRGLLCKSFFSLESFLPPRLDGAAAWLFSAVSEGSLDLLVLWSAEAGLGFRPPKTQEKMALMRKRPAKVANSVESRTDPERPLTWSRMRLTAWDTGVSESGRAGNFSCTQTDTFQINHQNTKLSQCMLLDLMWTVLVPTLPSVQPPLRVSWVSGHRGSQWEKTPFCTSASTKPADGSFQNEKHKYTKYEIRFRLQRCFYSVSKFQELTGWQKACNSIFCVGFHMMTSLLSLNNCAVDAFI